MLVCDRDIAAVEALALELDNSGKRVIAHDTDVTDPASVDAAVQRATSQWGGLHVLVNNAGVLRSTRVEQITTDEWDLVVDVNLKGAFLCTKAVLPIMKRQQFGRIINMSSSAGRSVSTLGGVHYTAAKAGLLGLSRGVAKEVAPFGITVNAVCPGLIDTKMVRRNCPPERIAAYEQSFPIPRLGSPEEIADLVWFLATDAAYITGASIDINGGDLMI